MTFYRLSVLLDYFQAVRFSTKLERVVLCASDDGLHKIGKNLSIS